MSMKIWGKRMLALACAGAMLVPLAACGSDADAGKIRLSYLSWDNEQTSKPYIDEFEKENPDIKIDFSYAPPTSEYISTLQTRLVGNQAPDVFIITSENRDDLIDNGYAKDLTDESFMKNISQANKDFVGRDGKTYGMSITSWVSGIAYNKDLLKQVGYDEPPGELGRLPQAVQEAQERRHRAVPRAERRRAEPLHRRLPGIHPREEGRRPDHAVHAGQPDAGHRRARGRQGIHPPVR